MIGQKGVPATYGGVERHVEEIGARLAARGHQVRVYTRRHYGKPAATHRGMELVRLASIPTKHLDAITHSLLATCHCLHWADLVHVHGIGPALVSPLVRLSPRPLVVTVHAQDYERDKWGPCPKAALRAGERAAMRYAHEVTAVSRELTNVLERNYSRKVHCLPNGVVLQEPPPAARVREEFGLDPDAYLLFAARLVPEKGADLLLAAYRRLEISLPLVLAGGSSHSDRYVERLRDAARGDARVRMLGYVHGESLQALYAHCRAFVLPSKVEGLSLGLLEALALGALVVASDLPANLEVLDPTRQQPCGLTFHSNDVEDLQRALGEAIGLPTDQRQALLSLARQRLQQTYDWDTITAQLDRIYQEASTSHRH